MARSPEQELTGKLDAEDVATLTRWVQMGAPWSDEVEVVVDESAGEDEEEPQELWGYGPLARPAVPAVAGQAWVRNPIDAFLLAALEQRGLTPTPPANKVSLVRRATYDLTGLPPTPAEVDAFLADDRPDAYDVLIERLLASPHYGEKWARHWLDLVRYAETNGFERDTDKPFIWRYRDYVIDAFNADKPYDRFVLEQLAGDELDEVTPETLVATGYTRLMQWDDEPGQGVLQARYDTLDDLVSTTSQVFLGVTMGCARCHDHKKDDIPQADYYRFMAFFHGLTDLHVGGPLTEVPTPEERLAYEREVAEKDAECARFDARLRSLEEDFRVRLRALDAAALLPATDAATGEVRKWIEERGAEVWSADELAAWRDLLSDARRVNGRKVPIPRAFAAQESGPDVPVLHVHVRGNAAVPGAEVAPAFPAMLDPSPADIPEPAPGAKTSGRRRVLAEWIASSENPMTARVMANRLWQFHFGRGIVRTPNDFGGLGEGTTNPALLDWLATEFIARGFSVKAMHRLIMNSNAPTACPRATIRSRSRSTPPMICGGASTCAGSPRKRSATR